MSRKRLHFMPKDKKVQGRCGKHCSFEGLGKLCIFKLKFFRIMGCGSGCGTGSNGLPAGCNNNGACGVGDSCNKLTVFDWLGNMSLPAGQKPFEVVEVRFKNSRKEFYRNSNNLPLSIGDPIAVEASSGHDIGTVSLTGELVRLQLKKKNINFDSAEIRKIYRKARQADLDKWKEARALETSTMYRARTIALRLGLEMKLSDVEYQGDKSKAIFYYTADARVDFRELIKVLAEEFRVRIEMRQIGSRQEASRLGGIGSCGRELCCATWLTDFRTVNTSAARYQQLSLNPLKLAGQCGKLKCCLNYELDSYIDALKEFPDLDGKKLVTKKGDAFLQKTDIFRRMMWFSYRSEPGVFIPMHIDGVKAVLEANAKGEIPEALIPTVKAIEKILNVEPVFENLVGQDSLTRFDKKGGKGKGAAQKGNKGGGRNAGNNQNQRQKPPRNNQAPKSERPAQAEGAPPRDRQNQQRAPKPQQGDRAKSQNRPNEQGGERQGGRNNNNNNRNRNRNQGNREGDKGNRGQGNREQGKGDQTNRQQGNGDQAGGEQKRAPEKGNQNNETNQ
jgi:cell fate regulator YaaT (PSP1 superfamily)